MTNLRAQIEDDWPRDSPVAQACLDIWDHLHVSAQLPDHYSYGDLEALTNIVDRASLTKALLYLASPAVAVLKTSLLYEFDGQILELPEKEQLHFAAGEHVIHPYLGEPLSEDEVFLAFEPGRRLAGGEKP